MKLRSVTYALFIAGLAAFSTSSLAAQSLRFGYETSQTDSQHIAAKKFNDLLQERTKGELKLKLFPDSTLGNAQAGNDSNLLIVFYVQIMPDDFVMQLHRF
ncbi:hypothetical protein CDN92_22790 [Escherichia coli]|nr:2,3-diketo-L-gulonate-binding periplasmic protein yiaO [Escherichia coli KTE107]PAS52667.1 hypothetical protein CDN90_22755 [Escherichia coli]PAS78351.1 hypothetical protein CDN92_22790 [Escherichia coli]